MLAVARRIFTDTFLHRYDSDAFEQFCEGMYAVDGPMARDLGSPDIDRRIAVVDAKPIGYAKLTPLRAPAPELYLTVFDHSHRAKRFYARHGFREVGRCTFTLGAHIDNDRIGRKKLAE
ncbi:MAG: hypothetical protein ACREPH_01440 [Rhodanobacteraceae bacterium]